MRTFLLSLAAYLLCLVALPAWARNPGAISTLLRSGGATGSFGAVEQAASASAPPSRIASFLIAGLSLVCDCCVGETGQLARGS